MKKLTLLFLVLLSTVVATAKVRLPQMFQSGMVLQREKPIPVWGTADSGEQVTVTLTKGRRHVATVAAVADGGGRWQATLPQQKAGGPFRLSVADVVIDDVLIGDVWLCSGQSNIDVTVERVYPQYGSVIDDYENAQIRMFRVQTDYDTHGPKSDVKPTPINWKPVTKQNAWLFSAVGYFLGREMFAKTGVPQGVIVNSLGGTPIQAWLSADTLRQRFPKEWERTVFFQDDSMVQAMQRANQQTQQRWQQLLNDTDAGLAGGWAGRDFDDSQWPLKPAFGTQPNGRPQSLNLADGRSYHGTVWARQYVHVDAAHAGQACRLLVGTLYDADQTYVNGRLVGQTGYQYPPRRYAIPAGVLVEGRNALTVRITTKGGLPHFIPEKPYKLVFDDGTEVALGSEWRVHEGVQMQPCPGIDAGGQNLPTVLYNAMLHPLAPYALRGVVWYQGESNTGGDAEHYETWLTELVTGWRQLWKQPALPFVIVQLANFMEPTDHPQHTNWSVVREAQRLVASRLAGTALACIIDLGEAVDIHPLRKREVAQRVARCFDHLVWNKKVLLSPQVLTATASGREVSLTLDQPLKTDGQLYEFEVAGDDGRFVNAEAVGRGTTITVTSVIDKPKSVRYAWKNNPAKANAYGKGDMPMSPFTWMLQ